MILTRVFIHGLDSSSQGTKASYFREHYPEMVIEDFSGALKDKMYRLETLLAGKTGLVLVGSSYGGLMASLFTLYNQKRVHKLVLLAPALNFLEFDPEPCLTIDLPVVIYHGLHDELIPAHLLKTVASRHFKNMDFNLVDDDHSLHRTFRKLNWDELLCLSK